MEKCIGCGFCCMAEPCIIAKKMHGEEIENCPELYFKNGRYWCRLAKTSPNLIIDMIGTGCGIPYNKFRKNVKENTFNECIQYYTNEFIGDIKKTGM